jgi:hypothetical protein
VVYGPTSLLPHFPLSRSSGNAIMALTCFGLRLTASGSQDADLGSTGRCSTCKQKLLVKLSDNQTHQEGGITSVRPELLVGAEGLFARLKRVRWRLRRIQARKFRR